MLSDVRVKKFQDIYELVTTPFQSLYKDPKVDNITKIVKNFSFFPRFMEDNQNDNLMHPFSAEIILIQRSSFIYSSVTDNRND